MASVSTAYRPISRLNVSVGYRYYPLYLYAFRKGTVMDTTVTQIGSVVVAELRAAGNMESTIVNYGKSIKTLAGFIGERGSAYTP